MCSGCCDYSNEDGGGYICDDCKCDLTEINDKKPSSTSDKKTNNIDKKTNDKDNKADDSGCKCNVCRNENSINARNCEAIMQNDPYELFDLGSYYCCEKKYPKALECYMRAISFLTEEEKKQGICSCLVKALGRCFEICIRISDERSYDVFLGMDDSIKKKCSNVPGYDKFDRTTRIYRIINKLKYINHNLTAMTSEQYALKNELGNMLRRV